MIKPIFTFELGYNLGVLVGLFQFFIWMEINRRKIKETLMRKKLQKRKKIILKFLILYFLFYIKNNTLFI
jgi:hypothetical protein